MGFKILQMLIIELDLDVITAHFHCLTRGVYQNYLEELFKLTP